MALLDKSNLIHFVFDYQGFVNKLKKTHGGGKNRRFDEIRTKQSWFVVKHFAGPVPYDSAAFLDKNKDQLSMDVVKLVTTSSTDDYIKNLFAADPKFLETAPADRR